MFAFVLLLIFLLKTFFNNVPIFLNKQWTLTTMPSYLKPNWSWSTLTLITKLAINHNMYTSTYNYMGFNTYWYYIDDGCRKKSKAKKVVCIPATDEADLWTWRKYGQKYILGSNFPRYSCIFIYNPIFVYILYFLQHNK